MNGDDSLKLYAKARALRTFVHLGETFKVVRWRTAEGKLWRGYTALLHDGYPVATELEGNLSDAENPWEARLARVWRADRQGLLRALREVKERLP